MSADACTEVAAGGGDLGSDLAPARVAADLRAVVSLVAVQLDRSARGMAATAAPDGEQKVHERLDDNAVVPVRRSPDVEGSPVASTNKRYLVPR